MEEHSERQGNTVKHRISGYGKAIVTPKTYSNGAGWIFELIFEAIDVISHFEKNPKRKYLRRIAGIAITSALLISVVSLKQGSDAYELAARASAYDILSKERPSQVAFYKTFNDLANIEDISYLNFSVPVGELEIDGCSNDILGLLLPYFNSACSTRSIKSSTLHMPKFDWAGKISFSSIRKGYLEFDKMYPNTWLDVINAEYSEFYFNAVNSLITLNNLSFTDVEYEVIHSTLKIQQTY